MRRQDWLFYLCWAMLWCTILVPSEVRAQSGYTLDLDFTKATSIQQRVTAMKGRRSGGRFGQDGWTTTSRKDMMLLPLPPQLDTRQGTITLTATNFEFGAPTKFFESYILVSMDSTGFPFRPSPVGTAGIQLLYISRVPENTKKGRQPVVYFGVFDPSCKDWRRCTTETRATPFWLQPKTSHTWTVRWQANKANVRFQGKRTLNKSMDISKTSPRGEVKAPKMTLMINACGASKANACGLWKGPAARKGGPLGVTYQRLTLTLTTPCGDKICRPLQENCQTCPQDCGTCPGRCGDGRCEAGKEDCKSCPKDCGVCPPLCGDGRCDNKESCAACPKDCGPCAKECMPPSCGEPTPEKQPEPLTEASPEPFQSSDTHTNSPDANAAQERMGPTPESRSNEANPEQNFTQEGNLTLPPTRRRGCGCFSLHTKQSNGQWWCALLALVGFRFWRLRQKRERARP